MDDEDKRSRMPRWWMDGSGPMAIGAAASLIGAAMTWIRFRMTPHDGFGIVIMISVLANVAALDNCRDGTERHRYFVGGLAVCSLVLAVVIAIVAFGGAPAAGAGPG